MRQRELVLGFGEGRRVLRFKVVFCEKEEKRRLEGCWSLWWEGFLILFIVAMGINFLMLVA